MILVDSSVWIDFFRGIDTPQVAWLDTHLEEESLVVGDLILAEVLQGFKQEKGFNEARRMLTRLQSLTLGGTNIAIQIAHYYRKLRAQGVTIRGTVDLIIATRCLHNGLPLLHSDRDFAPFEQHLGLRTIPCA